MLLILKRILPFNEYRIAVFTRRFANARVCVFILITAQGDDTDAILFGFAATSRRISKLVPFSKQTILIASMHFYSAKSDLVTHKRKNCRKKNAFDATIEFAQARKRAVDCSKRSHHARSHSHYIVRK